MKKPINGFSKLDKSQKINWLIKNFFSSDKEVKKIIEKYFNNDKKLQNLHDEFAENTISNFNLTF